MPGEQCAIFQTVQEPEAVDENQRAIDGIQGGAAAEWIAHAAQKQEQKGVQRAPENQ